jgi:hypothetical protein
VNPLTEVQVRFNATSRDAWEVFGHHRHIVTQLLVSAALPRPGRLCVLGAGNGNDLDLGALRAACREVHLVDLDPDALAHAAKRQGCADALAVRCHPGVDVTGVLDDLARWSPHTAVTDQDLAACRDRPVGQVSPVFPGPFDVVASTCLLSQLIGSVVRSLGAGHPRFIEVVQAVRLGHLLLLTELLTPGGSGVLVTDVVSSDTAPGLGAVSEEQLYGVLVRLINQRNFFHGVNPAALLGALRNDPALAPRVEAVQSLRPWLWNLGPRTYAVWAATFRRRHG